MPKESLVKCDSAWTLSKNGETWYKKHKGYTCMAMVNEPDKEWEEGDAIWSVWKDNKNHTSWQRVDNIEVAKELATEWVENCIRSNLEFKETMRKYGRVI